MLAPGFSEVPVEITGVDALVKGATECGAIPPWTENDGDETTGE